MSVQAIVLIPNSISSERELDIKKIENLLHELYSKTSNDRILWIIVSDEFKDDNLIPQSLQIAKLAQKAGFILRNNIQYFHPIFPVEQGQIISVTTSILMLTKSKDYFFNKDPIREPHMWKDVEWGKGKRKNGKNPYHKNGKDPSNFWVLSHKDEDFVKTIYKQLTSNDVFERILSCSSIEGDTIQIYGTHTLLTPNIENSLSIRKITMMKLSIFKKKLIFINNSKTVQETPYKGDNDNFINKVFYQSSDKMNQLPSNSIDVIVTSPPYWGLRDYGHAKEYGKENDYSKYLQNISKVWSESFRVLKDGGSFWLNINSRMKKGDIVLIPADFYTECSNLGFKLYNIIYWYKRASLAGLTKSNVVDKFEYILIFFKGKPPKFNKTTYGNIDFGLNGEYEINTWIMDQLVGSLSKNIDKIVRGKKEIPGIGILKFPHTALFPTELVKRVLSISTEEGDIVLDPFMGTGTTAEVAKDMKRNFVGYEINKEYQKIIDYRLSKVDGNLKHQSLENFF